MTPDAAPVAITAENGVLTIILPVESIRALGGTASGGSLQARLPAFGADPADVFKSALAEPRSPKDPERVRIVKVVLTRSEIIGEAVIELAEPVTVHA